jgi:peptidoglycan/LPS O-acetylase OafA/YrhL
MKIFFPHLNGIRFIAAFLVIIHHIEQIKNIQNLSNHWTDNPAIELIGKLGVILFFVLSGFLITYLLIEEEKKYSKIHIVQFYIRRILRIWPLYFIIVISAFFIWPHFDLFKLSPSQPNIIFQNIVPQIILFALILPNIALAIYPPLPFASHTWSIGTEEQFYLIWPLLIRLFRKYKMILMCSIIMIYIIVNYTLHTEIIWKIKYGKQILNFWSMFNIDCMAIGGACAILLNKKSHFLKLLVSPAVLILSISTATILIASGIKFGILNNEIYAVIFGLIILNFTATDRTIIRLDYPFLQYLGNISFGLYMYHPVCIMIALAICKKLEIMSNWILVPSTFLLTVLMASVSYYTIEKYFLKWKNKFALIKSGSH